MATAVILQYRHIKENNEIHQQCSVILFDDFFSHLAAVTKAGESTFLSETRLVD